MKKKKKKTLPKLTTPGLIITFFCTVLFSTLLFIVIRKNGVRMFGSTARVPISSGLAQTQLRWEGLTITVPRYALDQKANISVSNLGNIKSNKFGVVEKFLLSIYPAEGVGAGEIKLNIPIILEYDLNNRISKDIIKRCGFNPSSLSFYISTDRVGRDNNGAYDGVIKLVSTIDSERNLLIGELPQLHGYQEFGIFTDIIVGADPSKYLLDCGNETKSYMDDEDFVFKSDGYRLTLPSSVQRPYVSSGFINNRVTLTLKEKDNPYIEIVSMDNHQKLLIKDLSNLEYPAYERSVAVPYFKGEQIVSTNVIDLNDREFLEITSLILDKKVYRVITVYNNSSKVLIFETYIHKDESKETSQLYTDTVRTIAGTLEEMKL